MANTIMLFGSSNITKMPENVLTTLQSYAAAGWNFVVGDGLGADELFQHILSCLGARDRTKIVTMGHAYRNKYELENIELSTLYDENNKCATIVDSNNNVLLTIDGVDKEMDLKTNDKYRQSADRIMLDMSDFAICLWNGKSSTDFSMIQLAGIKNKMCYVVSLGE